MNRNAKLISVVTISLCAMTIQALGKGVDSDGLPCNSTHTHCADGSCVRRYPKQCRGKCRNNPFLKPCKDGTLCIFRFKFCDGERDCRDGSDEADCSTCNKHFLFSCDNRRCVHTNVLCNGFNDCGDGSDESDVCRPTSPTTTTVGYDELKPRTGVTLEQWLYIICGTVGFLIAAACCGCCCLNLPARHKTRLRSALRLRQQRQPHIEQELAAVRINNDYTPEPVVRALAAANDRPPSYDTAQEVSEPMVHRRQGAGDANDSVDASSRLLSAQPPATNLPPSYQVVMDSGDYVELDQTRYVHRSLSSTSQRRSSSGSTEQTTTV